MLSTIKIIVHLIISVGISNSEDTNFVVSKIRDYFEEALGDNTVRWVPHTAFHQHQHGLVPAGLKWSGDRFLKAYVARATHGDGHLVGMWFQKYSNKLFGSFNWTALTLENVPIETNVTLKLLSYPRGTAYWLPVEDISQLPQNDVMVVGGKFPGTGEKMHICRSVMYNELIIGKFLVSEGVCQVPYKGQEHELEVYELLVKSMMYLVTGTKEL